MISTPHLSLAEAAEACRSGSKKKFQLRGILTSAQLGAALRLSEVDGIEVDADTHRLISKVRCCIEQEFHELSLAKKYIEQRFDGLDGLEQTFGRWLSVGDDDSRSKIGYLLMCIFLRGIDESETILFTDFLLNEPQLTQKVRSRKSIRRYPTGGVSEKQALILPAFLRYFANQFGWCSSFLVARRLAHTGGTHDKLMVLPGMKLTSINELLEWDGIALPVRYFSAGLDFCRRDAELYRIRGETGTVNDFGLMASSILAKQIGFRADVIILDVLYGLAAFIQTRDKAEAFANLCCDVAKHFGLSILPYFRRCDVALGRCIGNIVEVWEATQILYDGKKVGAANNVLTCQELSTSILFMKIFVEELMFDDMEIQTACIEALEKGDIFDALMTLWLEHGVDKNFVEQVRKNPRNAFLGDLKSVPILAASSGFVKSWNSVGLADLINNYMNAYVTTKSGTIIRSVHGGIEIIIIQGEKILAGETLAYLYGEETPPAHIHDLVSQMFNIQGAP